MRVQNQFLISKFAFLKLVFNIKGMTRVEFKMFALRLYPSVVKIPYSAHVCKKKNHKMYAVIRK